MEAVTLMVILFVVFQNRGMIRKDELISSVDNINRGHEIDRKKNKSNKQL